MSSILREGLAEYAHTAWSEYMDYFLSKLEKNPEGELIIPPAYAQALQRQIITPYADLSTTEQDYDRDEADKMIAVVNAWLESNCEQVIG